MTKHLPAKVQNALKVTAWDLPKAARMLGMSISKLDDALQQTRFLPRYMRELAKFPKAIPDEYRKMTLAQVEEDIARRLVLYRADAMSALHDLAMMPIDENSMNNQVKLQAAVRLYAETGEKTVGNEIEGTLRALNDEYHKVAPRIRSIRERTIEFESSDPRVIEGGE